MLFSRGKREAAYVAVLVALQAPLNPTHPSIPCITERPLLQRGKRQACREAAGRALLRRVGIVWQLLPAWQPLPLYLAGGFASPYFAAFASLAACRYRAKRAITRCAVTVTEQLQNQARDHKRCGNGNLVESIEKV